MKKKITNTVENYSFDKKLDYEVIKQEIDNKILQLTLELEENYNEHKIKALSNCTIALIQLTNGSRISEALKATDFFVKNPSKKSTYIRISKRKDNCHFSFSLSQTFSESTIKSRVVFSKCSFALSQMFTYLVVLL